MKLQKLWEILRSTAQLIIKILRPFNSENRLLRSQLKSLEKQRDSILMFGSLGVQLEGTKGITLEKDFLEFVSSLRLMEIETECSRLGSEGDGGYVVPLAVIENSKNVCFSAGVHLNSDFEFDLAQRGISCHLIDFSVEAPALSHDLLAFTQKFLSSTSFSDTHISLEDWINEFDQDSNLLLKMDIEGSEWPVLSALPNQILGRFSMIVIELHGLDRLNQAGPFSVMSGVLKKLLEEFDIVNAHPNNYRGESLIFGYRIPDVIELTLVHKKLGITDGKVASSLRAPNLKNNPDSAEILLDDFWFSSRDSIPKLK